MLHIILLGGTFQRRWAIRQLDADQQVLEDNLATLERINQEQLQALQTELDEINAEISELQASFPELGAPFDLYHRITTFTELNGMNLQSISRINAEDQVTAEGALIVEEYSIDLGGDLSSCINLIGALEEAGQGTVMMNQATIWLEENQCLLEMQIFGVSN
jgi:hypothetical protein